MFSKKPTKLLINFVLLLFFWSTCYYPHYGQPPIPHFGFRGPLNWTYFEEQNLALRLWQRFLFQLIFLLSPFVVLFMIEKWQKRNVCDHKTIVIIKLLDVFNCHLMVFLTLKLIVFRIITNTFIFAVFCSFWSNCYRAFL